MNGRKYLQSNTDFIASTSYFASIFLSTSAHIYDAFIHFQSYGVNKVQLHPVRGIVISYSLRSETDVSRAKCTRPKTKMDSSNEYWAAYRVYKLNINKTAAHARPAYLCLKTALKPVCPPWWMEIHRIVLKIFDGWFRLRTEVHPENRRNFSRINDGGLLERTEASFL